MGGIGALFGGMAYLICRYPNMRRAQFREWGPHPVMGKLLGGAILISFILSSWNMTFARFYGIEKDGQNIILNYHLPDRQEILPCGFIKKAIRQIDNPKSHTWELALILADGKIRRSAPMEKDDFDNAIRPFASRLCPGVEITAPTF